MSIAVIPRGPFARSGHNLKMGPEAGLSPLDHGLVTMLQSDGRTSFAQLARECRTTEKTVRKRVGELRESGLIEITTVTDPALLGYHSAAFLGIRLDGSRRTSDVAQDIFRIPQVDYAVATSGRYDLLVELLCRDDAELHRTIESEIRKRPSVREAEIYPHLRLHYQQPIWTAAQGKSKIRAVTDVARLDALDHGILRELNDDGRAAFSTVAERLGVSETQIRKRYAKMTASGAMRVMALANPRSLGFRTMAWLAIGAAPGAKIEALADHLAALPSITYLVVCMGRFDIFAEVVCKSPEDLLGLLDSQVRPLSEVARIESILCFDLYYRRVIAAR